MKVPAGPITKLGVIKDIPDYALPDGAWSDSSDFRFLDGKITTYQGTDDAFNIIAGRMNQARWAIPVQSNTEYFWLFFGYETASTSKAYVYKPSTDATTDITRTSGGDYDNSAGVKWVGDIISGLPVMANNSDAPQCWETKTTATKLTPVPYVTGTSTWGSLGYWCRSMRAFNNVLVAVDVTKSNRDPYMLKWSHPATSGTMPSSWDETDTTKKAGERIIDGIGELIDTYTLGQTHIVYGQKGLFGMQFIGGNSVYRTWRLSGIDHGVLSTNCVQNIKGGHVVLTNELDLVVHDGNSSESVLTERWRRHLYDNLNRNSQDRCFIARNDAFSEIWVWYPSDTGDPDKILIWNYANNTLYGLNSSDATHAEYGRIDIIDQKRDKLGVCIASGFFQETNNSSATITTPSLKRTGIDLGEPDRFKLVRGLWIKGTNRTGTINVKVGGAMTVDGAYTWTNALSFDSDTGVSTDRYLSVAKSGEQLLNYPFLGIEFVGDASVTLDYDLSDFDWDVELGGKI